MNNPTHRIPDLEVCDPQMRWGTAILRSDTQINLYFEGVVEPLPLMLTHPIILGRACHQNDSQIDVDLNPYGAYEKGVSRQHVVIENVQKTVMLTDLGSTNGTFLNGQQLHPLQRRVVRDGDEICLGDLVMHVSFERQLTHH